MNDTKGHSILSAYDARFRRQLGLGRYHEALWIAEEGYHFAVETYGPDHPETARVANNLGWIHDLLGNRVKAEYFYRRALATKQSGYASDSLELLPTLENLSSLLVVSQRFGEALDLLQTMCQIVEEKPPQWRIRKGVYLCRMGEIYEQTGSSETAESYYLRALSFIESDFDPQHLNLGNIMARLGRLYQSVRDFPKAEYYLLRALKLLNKKLPHRHPDVQYLRQCLQTLYHEMQIETRLP